LIFCTSPTDVPPNFWTTRDIVQPFSEKRTPTSPRGSIE
jgi:hypothetical protein